MGPCVYVCESRGLGGSLSSSVSKQSLGVMRDAQRREGVLTTSATAQRGQRLNPVFPKRIHPVRACSAGQNLFSPPYLHMGPILLIIRATIYVQGINIVIFFFKIDPPSPPPQSFRKTPIEIDEGTRFFLAIPCSGVPSSCGEEFAIGAQQPSHRWISSFSTLLGGMLSS